MDGVFLVGAQLLYSLCEQHTALWRVLMRAAFQTFRLNALIVTIVSLQRQAILDGRIRLRGQKVSLDAVINNGDWQSHIIHRHEPPVAGQPIPIVHGCEDYVSVTVCVAVVLLAQRTPQSHCVINVPRCDAVLLRRKHN